MVGDMKGCDIVGSNTAKGFISLRINSGEKVNGRMVEESNGLLEKKLFLLLNLFLKVLYLML